MTTEKKQPVTKAPQIPVQNNADLSPGEEEEIGKGKRKFGLNVDAANIITIFIVAIVAVFAMTQFITPMVGKGIYRSDITRLEMDLVKIREADTAIAGRIDAQNAKVNEVVQSLINQVNNELANYANKDTVSGMQSSIDNINSQIATINTNVAKIDYSEKIVEINASIAKVNTDIAGLNKSVSGIDLKSVQDKVTALQDKMTAAENSIKALQSQQNVTNIVVTHSSTNISFTNATQTAVPVTITNNGSGQATVTLKLILTTSTSGISLVDAAMNRTYTKTITSPNVTFLTDVIVEGNTSLTINPNVVLSFTGTNPNVWLATWSKN